MRELPIYRETIQDRGSALAHKLDGLLRFGQDRQDRLRKAIEALSLQCATETLRLTGAQLTLPEVIQVSSGREADSPNRDLILGQLKALETIQKAARCQRSLGRWLICEVHRLSSPPNGGRFRRWSAPQQFASATPSRPETISMRVDNLVDWIAAESVRSLRLPERAALAFARLLEIAPFERGNFRTAHLIMNFFSFQENYPPFFLRADDAEGIRGDIERAMQFDTLPLVNRLARAQSASLDYCLRAVQNGTAG